MLFLILLFLGVLLLSALCSMSEAAILSLPMTRARILVEQKHKSAEDVLFLKENISSIIAVIVVLNNAINIIGAIYLGQQVTHIWGSRWLGLASTIITLTIIIVAEIIPKMIGERYRIKISLLFAKPLRGLMWLFRPVVGGISAVAHSFLMRDSPPKVTEEEIKMMLKLGHDAGTVEMDEAVLCTRVFKLNDVRAFQIMRPMEDIFAFPAGKTLGEIREDIISTPYSRIAVFDKDPLDIVGTVQHRVLLREIAKDNYQAKVRDFMKKPLFVNWFTKADELLEKFQIYHQHLFIVQDTHGKDVGIVTMEDVLEELFGEIYDEKDVKPPRERGGLP
ncbi:MAG TPA: hemolysin family protein [Candidatus Omnitrophota bacterium]|nr:HlyC/CorC family transporter [Candidatus Omnitrophota bacterium]HQO58357.1 hemolysin family protein [Candidatus Omnitrophota bacterium]HQP11181.1 hemolysin family protein [Candidatus Omnitrophota bacterium]